MSRPLELVVYPHVRWQPEPGVIVPHPSFYEMPDGGLVHITEVYATAKRLTDAELAAEYWRAKYSVHLFAANGPRSSKAFYEACVWDRFATHPHHDEEARR